jgi:hypothetical protein
MIHHMIPSRKNPACVANQGWGVTSEVDSEGPEEERVSEYDREVATFSATRNEGVEREVHDRLRASTAYPIAYTVALPLPSEHNTSPPCEYGEASGIQAPAPIIHQGRMN